MRRGTARSAGSEGIRLPELPPGAVARVVGIDTSAAAWCERLQAYGLAPGLELTVVQHAPVTVVRVERTDLAFEPQIANGILVSRVGAGGPPVAI